ncbi:helix-turn-helix domain-containing protein [Rhizobiaceae bacterium CRRU44]|uniref:Helix-turn-helix domain-containing protein n=2 Tax=Ferranicluibacter rubi TaxID=2715133 RepID=A0AA44CCF7_9HYPH|nr:helix-turn-helix domain-containing protein [Ferranicluibacter rubi]NHT75962.1 helix-turn-helix domain-containing protein [Ferranicluibacter rubi]
MANNLRSLRKLKNLKLQDAADLMGVSRSQYVKLERGERRLTSDYIAQAAKAFGVDEASVIADQRTSRIVGRVGAGSEAHFYVDGDEEFEEVPTPPGGTEHTVGLEIRGDSIGPFFNQWLVFYDDVRNPVTADLIGHLCIVETIEGKVLVKKLMKGSEQGLFHLLSQTESPMEDQDLVWAAKVTALTPR